MKVNSDLEREIRQIREDDRIAGRTTPGQEKVTFESLLQDDDPNAMKVAEDFLLERGWKLREATGALHARNFTFAMNPMFWPRHLWKMVQTNVDAFAGVPGRYWAKVSAANGAARVEREREFNAASPDDARRVAVANAWAIAKLVKRLSLDASESQLKKAVDAEFTAKTRNLRPPELF